LALQADSTSALAAMATYQAALRGEGHSYVSDPRVLAERWAASDPSPEAALEWVASSLRSGDVEAEIAARAALLERLDPEARPALRADLALLKSVHRMPSLPLQDARDPATTLVNLELALPGSAPAPRAAALDALGDLLGSEDAALRASLMGYNLLAVGDTDGASSAFRAAVDAFADDPAGWEGLRAVARHTGDTALLAEATASLAHTLHDPIAAAEHWEQAGLLYFDELGDPERGEQAFAQAVRADIRRDVCYDRLFRLVRARQDHPALLALIAPRLEVTDDPEEIVKLYWERARVLRETGDRDGALAALESVAVLDPDHVGALALTGEIHITRKDFASAAETLGRLARLGEAPAKQRLMSGVASADLYESKLGNLEQALSVLIMLFDEGLTTLAVRERLARVAAKTESWQEATRVLSHLMQERSTAEGRAEAARLSMVIWRDRLQDPGRSLAAVKVLLREAPGDGEATDLVLSDAFPHETTRSLLEASREALVSQLARQPLSITLIARLARIAAHEGDLPLRQAALGALVALGAGSPETEVELAALDERVAHVPQIAVDASSLPELTDPEDTGPIAALMAWLAPGLAEALGPQLSTFGVGRADRVDPRKGLPLRNEVAAWAGALGVGDFDLYVGRSDPELIVGLPTERPALVVGTAVTSPLGIQHRQAVARELFAIVRGTCILRHRDPTDIAALVVAACRVGGHQIDSPPYAMLPDLERQLGRGLPRRYRRGLVERGAAVAATAGQPLDWVAAAVSTLDRLATIAAGDVSRVLANDAMLGRSTASMESSRRAERLLAFALSYEYLLLRERLGMGVK
jgi:tetratricopeptide (TPR) repeat protein